MSNSNSEFRTGLKIGLICAVVSAFLGALISYWLVKIQIKAETINQKQVEKIKKLHDALVSIADARDVAWPPGTSGHDEQDPEVKSFITITTTFCGDYKSWKFDNPF